MYCRECGRQIPDNSKFCKECGAKQSGGNGGGSNRGIIAIAVLLGVIACVLLVLLLTGNRSDSVTVATEPTSVSVQSEATEAPRPTETQPEPTETQSAHPESGWHEEGGSRYYYSDSEKVTGLQEIGNKLYYFNEDGSLAVNTTVDYGGNLLEINRDGHITAATFAFIDGEWSSDKFRFGNNGRSSIKILETEVTNCDETGFYLEASGLRGAKVNCNWKIHVRSHGKWVFVKEIYFTEPSGTFTIKFDKPMDFDAITAYPTVQGNASYSSYFALVDVHMGI